MYEDQTSPRSWRKPEDPLCFPLEGRAILREQRIRCDGDGSCSQGFVCGRRPRRASVSEPGLWGLGHLAIPCHPSFLRQGWDDDVIATVAGLQPHRSPSCYPPVWHGASLVSEFLRIFSILCGAPSLLVEVGGCGFLCGSRPHFRLSVKAVYSFCLIQTGVGIPFAFVFARISVEEGRAWVLPGIFSTLYRPETLTHCCFALATAEPGVSCSFFSDFSVPLCHCVPDVPFRLSRFASHRLLPTPIPLSVSLGLGPARLCGFYFRWVSRPWPLLPPAGLCQTLPCAPKKRIGGSGPLAHNRSPFPWPRQAWLVAFALLGLLCFAVPCLRFAACAASTIAGSGECIWHFVWLFLARLRVTGSFCHSRARSGSSGAAFLICLCFAGAACCELQTALTPERVEALATEVIQICLLLATLSLCGLIFRVIGFSLSPLGRGFLRVCSLAGNDWALAIGFVGGPDRGPLAWYTVRCSRRRCAPAWSSSRKDYDCCKSFWQCCLDHLPFGSCTALLLDSTRLPRSCKGLDALSPQGIEQQRAADMPHPTPPRPKPTPHSRAEIGGLVLAIFQAQAMAAQSRIRCGW